MLSLSEAIKQFALVDQDYQKSKGDRAELGAVLADYARDSEATQNTVHLQDGQIKIDVDFKNKVEFDPELMRDVAQLLGPKFDELFETVIIFKPKTRALKMFLNTRSPVEAEETAKKIIGDAKKETPQTPYVHVAKTSG